jgi:hypothetical protein
MLKNQLIAFLFAGVLSANMGHNIFPHHHHYDSLISHQGCQEHDDENSFEAGDPTSFCHAFNGIEYYPAPVTRAARSMMMRIHSRLVIPQVFAMPSMG